MCLLLKSVVVGFITQRREVASIFHTNTPFACTKESGLPHAPRSRTKRAGLACSLQMTPSASLCGSPASAAGWRPGGGEGRKNRRGYFRGGGPGTGIYTI